MRTRPPPCHGSTTARGRAACSSPTFCLDAAANPAVKRPAPSRLFPFRSSGPAIGDGALEREMELHASSTCSLRFDNAARWLLGEPRQELGPVSRTMSAATFARGLSGCRVAGGSRAHRPRRCRRRSTEARSGPEPSACWPGVERFVGLWTSSVVGGAAALPDLVESHLGGKMST